MVESVVEVEILQAANDAAFRMTGEANRRSLAACGMTYSPTIGPRNPGPHIDSLGRGAPDFQGDWRNAFAGRIGDETDGARAVLEGQAETG